jgi:hypothetical protein
MQGVVLVVLLVVFCVRGSELELLVAAAGNGRPTFYVTKVLLACLLCVSASSPGPRQLTSVSNSINFESW